MGHDEEEEKLPESIPKSVARVLENLKKGETLLLPVRLPSVSSLKESPFKITKSEKLPSPPLSSPPSPRLSSPPLSSSPSPLLPLGRPPLYGSTFSNSSPRSNVPIDNSPPRSASPNFFEQLFKTASEIVGGIFTPSSQSESPQASQLNTTEERNQDWGNWFRSLLSNSQQRNDRPPSAELDNNLRLNFDFNPEGQPTIDDKFLSGQNAFFPTHYPPQPRQAGPNFSDSFLPSRFSWPQTEPSTSNSSPRQETPSHQTMIHDERLNWQDFKPDNKIESFPSQEVKTDREPVRWETPSFSLLNHAPISTSEISTSEQEFFSMPQEVDINSVVPEANHDDGPPVVPQSQSIYKSPIPLPQSEPDNLINAQETPIPVIFSDGDESAKPVKSFQITPPQESIKASIKASSKIDLQFSLKEMKVDMIDIEYEGDNLFSPEARSHKKKDKFTQKEYLHPEKIKSAEVGKLNKYIIQSYIKMKIINFTIDNNTQNEDQFEKDLKEHLKESLSRVSGFSFNKDNFLEGFNAQFLKEYIKTGKKIKEEHVDKDTTLSEVESLKKIKVLDEKTTFMCMPSFKKRFVETVKDKTVKDFFAEEVKALDDFIGGNKDQKSKMENQMCKMQAVLEKLVYPDAIKEYRITHLRGVGGGGRCY